tara:strand:- start:1452 stop:1982 length:531 start_codon:yes stop_codon:yes gene_type:complete
MKEAKSKTKAFILALIIFVLLLGSMFLAIIAFQDIPKYNKPYLFTILVSAIGFVIGYFTWKKVKPTVLKYSQRNNNDTTLSVFVMMSVVGLMLFAVNGRNVLSANKTSCDSYTIINKYRKEGGFRRPEINTLVVEMNGKSETLVCKYKFWDEKSIGNQINVCFYKSIFSFNYIEMV